MGFKIISQPGEMPVSLDEARTAARANASEMDVEIRAQVGAFTAQAEHIIGLAIINRTGRVTLDSFPASIDIPKSATFGGADVPMTPVFTVNEITYFDIDGNEQTLSTSLYSLGDDGVIELVPGAEWPETQVRSNAVKIDVVCGCGADDASTPPAFKGYILAKTREYFAPAGSPESPNLVRMLDSLKVYS